MLYFSFVKMHAKKAMQYRASLFMMSFAQMISTLVSLLTIYFLFGKFKIVEGWSFEQILLTYSVSMLSFSFSECFFRGMDIFAHSVKMGEFDRMLVRPRGIIHQVLCSGLELSKMGRFLVAVVVLVYAMTIQKIVWTFAKVMVVLTMCVCGIVVFLGLFMLGAAFSVFTVDGLEVVNIFTDGGRDLCQYPLNVYGKAITKIFTFVVPFACFNLLPMKYLFDMQGATIAGNALAPLFGCLFIVPCYIILRLSLKRYQSTGT